jgi:hypothetical protein
MFQSKSYWKVLLRRASKWKQKVQNNIEDMGDSVKYLKSHFNHLFFLTTARKKPNSPAFVDKYESLLAETSVSQVRKYLSTEI